MQPGKMSIGIFILLLVIGFIAGALSGFVGIGGGVIIVPALIYIIGMTQHEAQGTSLLLMLPPIGILAVMNYYKAGNINWMYGIVVASAFVIGGFFGSKISLKLSPAVVKLSFGFIMLYVAVTMIISGYKSYRKDEQSNRQTEETQ